MDRILLGKSPEVEAGITSPEYNRAGNTGLWVSKPGANVMSCSENDLLFDSTANGFFQVLGKDTEFIPKATSLTEQSNVTIYTTVISPYADSKATVLVRWNTLVPSSNLHPTAYSSSFGTGASESLVVCPAYLDLDGINLRDPNITGLVPGYSLSARTYANTNNTPPTVDIEFTNGSPHIDHIIAWTLYRAEVR
jgi:hypothetical protein